MNASCEAPGNGSDTGSTVDLGNWISAIRQMAWRRIRHPFQAAVNRRHGHEIAAHFPAQPDLPQVLEPRRNNCTPSLILKKLIPLLDAVPQPIVAGDQACPAYLNSSDQMCYLLGRKNCTKDIDKLSAILKMPQVLLEIGCGNAEVAQQIALKNPGIGVIATDLYDWSDQSSNGSGYGKIAREWRARQLPAQIATPANLVILRAEASLLRCLPLRAIDTILLLNPEPFVGKAFLDLLQGESLSLRIKHGPLQIVILPYSRELGLAACGGFSFEHDPDWSRGLGFILGSGLGFKLGASTHWGVDLSRISAYTGNSTQRGIYVCGAPPN
jgi:hypothetical protein